MAVISASIFDLELELVWSTTGQDRFYSNFTITVPASPFCVIQTGEACTEQMVESLLFGGLVCQQVLDSRANGRAICCKDNNNQN